MSTIQLVAAFFGFLIIVATVWNLVRRGLARSNGKVETLDINTGRNTEWLGGGH